ncbi:class I SAM-dependent methyltransferase [Paracoccus ravus]|uniref:class I SAM-dependent methyltransferase n=1 Tax=Paracoccus ravus TaxID=2447760 RepID=UPI00106E6702|nr:methyltransferase domain-containing protein [Paracoccus ravus]
MSAPRILYNLGSGPRSLFSQLPDRSAFSGWSEVRVDIDKNCNPDIVADLTDLRQVIADGAAGMIFCSHVVEHFFDHDVPVVLAEIARILHPDGAALLRLPDLSAVVRSFDEGELEKTLYHSPSGPIAALDVIYGHRRSIRDGNHYMAHRTGFTQASLARRMLAAGFEEVQTSPGPSVEFCAVATRRPTVFQPQVDALLSYINP